MIIYLDSHIAEHFPNQNAFDFVMAMRGKTYRELENRRTQYVEIAGKGYFLKQHFGVGWKEIFKNLMQGRLPVLGATNEWLAARKLQAQSIPTLSVVGFGKRSLNLFC
jgi:heptose I phosphotransferase